jgi:hypothetical protein
VSEAAAPDARDFYTRAIPDDFNRSVDAQAALGDAGRRVHDAMCALSGTLRIDLVGAAPATVYLNIESGRMRAGDTPGHAPFLRVVQDEAALHRLARETDGSLTALLGALAGLGGEMKLTRKRMLDLEAVDGLIRFEVTGDDGFVLLAHFGTREMPEAPDAVIRMDEASYAAMRAGEIDPQTAFLDDAIQTEGDLQKIMQLAFALVAPD